MLIRGGTLLPMTEPRALEADLFAEDGRISRIGGVEAPREAEVIDASGCYVIPGLVQSHIHLVQTIFRGLAEGLTLLEWLRTRVWPLEAAHTESSLRASARLGLADLLQSGTTTILDMGTTHGEEFVADEIARSGIRARFGKAMMDSGEGVPPRLREKTRESLDESEALRRRWDGAEDGRLGYAYAPRFVLSCTRELLEEVGERAAEHGALIHTHSNESAEERAVVEREIGRSPIGYLADLGVAMELAVFAHGVHVDADERRLLAERGTAVAHCPSSNLKLGSGFADIVALRAAGVVVGIGADGAACNNRLDGFEEARLAALLASALHGAGAIDAWRALGLATRDGARALHLDDECGTLEVGKRADLVILDAERLGGPGGDPATRILFGGGSRAVREVVVDGRILVRGGELVALDATEARARAREELPRLLERAGL
jgi:5-methylthioadenosine/S-adenosylhomocysteine deaminase